MQFVCRYGTPDGHVLTETRTGSDESTIRRALEHQGLHIFEIRPRGMPLKISLPWNRRKKIPDEQFLAFNQEMVALLRAGLPLLQALELMLERMEDPQLRSVLIEIRDRIQSGEELSEAFASFGDLFPPLYPATLKAGETSGELESVIRRFIRYLRLVITTRKKMTSALVYPTVLISLSIGMLTIMAIFVVPKFTKFYEDLNAELPALTRFTLGVSFWMRNNAPWIAIAGVVLFFFYRSWSSTASGRVTVDRWRLKIPLVGAIYHQFSLAEFCRSLATLLAGGIPLVSSLDTAVGAVSNRFVAVSIAPSIDRVREGQAFHDALDKTEVFPNMAIGMIKVGEATGSLDEMLNAVSDYFDDKVETRIERLLTLVEPIMLIVMGSIIALILISIYLPMFSAFSQVGD